MTEVYKGEDEGGNDMPENEQDLFHHLSRPREKTTLIV